MWIRKLRSYEPLQLLSIGQAAQCGGLGALRIESWLDPIGDLTGDCLDNSAVILIEGVLLS